MNTSVIAAIIIAAAILLFWLIMSYKGFANLKNSADAAFSDVEIYYKKRQDAAAELVKLMKKKTQEEVLQNVKDAIELAESADNAAEKIQYEGVLEETIQTLFQAAESHEDLLKNRRFQKIQERLQTAERNIASTRKVYNTIAKMMNQRVNAFPSNLIAKMFHFTERPVI